MGTGLWGESRLFGGKTAVVYHVERPLSRRTDAF